MSRSVLWYYALRPRGRDILPILLVTIGTYVGCAYVRSDDRVERLAAIICLAILGAAILLGVALVVAWNWQGGDLFKWIISRGDDAGVAAVLAVVPPGVISARDRYGDTALHDCSDGRLSAETMGRLIRAGAQLNVRGRKGQTPLHRAASNGQIGLVRVLLENGADKTIADNDGKTARDYANKSGHTEVAEILE